MAVTVVTVDVVVVDGRKSFEVKKIRQVIQAPLAQVYLVLLLNLVGVRFLAPALAPVPVRPDIPVEICSPL